MVKTLSPQRRGHGFDPESGNEITHTLIKDPTGIK